MKFADPTLVKRSLQIQDDLWRVVASYEKMRDARWMFAFAHFRITQQINETIPKGAFRDPDQLIRFNLSFATAFLAAVAGMTTAPWREAFDICEGLVTAAVYNLPGCQVLPKPPEECRVAASLDPQPIIMCSVAMAKVHINTDIVNSLRTVGCIDINDYANILVFVEKGARDAIYVLTGKVVGPTADALKRTLLPLDKIWRNAVYKQVCGTPVPGIEQSFRDRLEKNSRSMSNIRPSVH
jgi:hypothetical protein